MKVTGKITKTEGCLLVLTAVFLAAVGLLYLRASAAAEGTDYTITASRRAAQEAAPAPEEPAEPEEPSGPVDINTADLEQLQTLNGIGPALAQRIIDYREENGPFTSVEELLQIKGIGEATLNKFRDHVTTGTEAPADDLPTEEAAA